MRGTAWRWGALQRRGSTLTATCSSLRPLALPSWVPCLWQARQVPGAESCATTVLPWCPGEQVLSSYL